MKVETNSVLTVELDGVNDQDFLIALEKIAKRDNVTLEKAFNNVVSIFLSTSSEPHLFTPEGGAPPRS